MLHISVDICLWQIYAAYRKVQRKGGRQIAVCSYHFELSLEQYDVNTYSEIMYKLLRAAVKMQKGV